MKPGIIKTLKILSWIVVLTGVVCTLKGMNVLPMHHHAPDGHVCFWKQIHVISGIIIILIMLWHGHAHRKWYAAWLKGKLKSHTPSMLLTKQTSLVFVLATVVLLLKPVMSWGIFSVLHIASTLVLAILSVRHCKSRVGNNRRYCRRRNNESAYQ